MNFYKKVFVLLTLVLSVNTFAQKGEISGKILDADMNNEPLPFANVFIKGTEKGTTSDFDGNYIFSVEEGTYTLVFSFIGYETVEIPNVTVVAGEETVVEEVVIGASQGVALDEVVITGSAKKESETALLSAQKNSTVIVESIGTERLTKLGVSNAAAATSKISGVTKNEGSGDVYIRGLGDRYLSTTMNGLPIPSDDVEKKNINLDLFSTDVIQNVGITKTYATESYIDQASGNVNIVSKYGKQDFAIAVRTGTNSNVAQSDVWNNFKTSPNMNDTNFGFYTKNLALTDAITQQTWNTETRSTPLDYKIRFTGGDTFFEKLSVFFTGSHAARHEYREGLFRSYRSNVLDNSFTDATQWTTTINSTALIDFHFRINENHKISYNTLFVNKTVDNLYEAGRNGEGYVFDQDPSEDGAFVRDQNLKQTRMFVNQFLGDHKITEKNHLKWGAGYNYVWAAEPNRIRNEVNTLAPEVIEFSNVSDFQQRKTSQKIVDEDYNAYIKDQITLFDDEDTKMVKLNFGGNFRSKERKFRSEWIGVRARGVQTESIDNLNVVFTDVNFINGTLELRERIPDLYNATLNIYAGFVNFDFSFDKLSGNIGARYEADEIKVDWDVSNFVGRTGDIKNNYENFAPSLNLKYKINDLQAIRLAASKTLTLPEFKELAPFEYVAPTGRVTRGNPDLLNSTNYNLDVKYEMYPTSKQLISLTGFYKAIQDPINLVQTRGSSGIFSYDNTGEQADVFGLELESRIDIVEVEEIIDLSVSANFTQMWFNQDLFEEFQYNNKTETELQGAASQIFNGAINYSNNQENEFGATISANYSSDKIFALGSPEDFAASDRLYNDEIIQKGFWKLDVVLRKQFNEHFSMNFRALNILNPEIKQTQKVKDIPTQIETTETVLSYKNGVDFRLGFKYTF